MADETKETAVTDETLSKAQDEATEVSEESQIQEEAVSETQEAEETVDEHKERSGLGRRVSKMENSINSFMEEMRATIKSNPQSEQEQYSSEEKYISTEQDLEEWYQRRTMRDSKQKQKYDDDYLKTFDKLADEENLDDDTFNEVSKLLTQTFNKSESKFKNPQLDAKLNFTNAMRAIEKSKGKASPLNGGTPKGGLVGQTKGSVKQPKVPDLDDDAKALLQHLKKSGSDLAKDENLSKVFNGETNRSLRKNESIQG